MSRRKQTRRSISVKGLTYQWIFDFCQSQDPPLSISGFIENVVQDRLDQTRIPRPKVLTARPRAKKDDFEEEPPYGNHFTF